MNILVQGFMYMEVEFLGCMISLFHVYVSFFLRNWNYFLKLLYRFTFPPAVNEEASSFSVFLQEIHALELLK